MNGISVLRTRCKEANSSFPLKLTQMVALYVMRGIGPGYFLQARFWRPGIDFAHMCAHQNHREYAATIDRLNPANFRKITQHKLAEKALLTANGIPTPKYVGFFHPSRGVCRHGTSLRTLTELGHLLNEHANQRLCFKRAEGSGGSSFVALDVERTQEYSILRNPVTGITYEIADWYDELKNFKGGALIEAYLPQHPTLAALNPDSLNTLRLLVLEENGHFTTRGGILRIGRKGSQVDNTSSGGFACPIDLSSGTVLEAIDLSPARESFDTHPDSGIRIAGMHIPFWGECMELAEFCLSIYPNMRFAGMDIAVGEDGPCVIELNVDPDRKFATHLDLPHKTLFGKV